MDVPAGVTPEEGHTGFFNHLLFAVRALIFLARRIQALLSLVDREIEFCVLTIQSFSTRWAVCIKLHITAQSGPVILVMVVIRISHSAHWLPTRKKLLYTVANPARGLLNREKKKKKKKV